MFGRYTGPFAANPKKTREQREDELLELMQSADGRDIVLRLYQQAKGIPLGQMVPIGTLFSEMVSEIVSHEYGEAKK